MEKVLRKTGIAVMGQAPWGSHLCQFYQTKADLLDILVPYFKAGLEGNEFCMWVTSQPLEKEEARRALAAAVPDLDRYLQAGQIEFLSHDQWYTLGGRFDADRVLQGWVARLEQAQARGFAGLRLTGNTFWLEDRDWRSFAAYDARVDAVIGRYRMMALCSYSLDRCRAAELIDVVANHQIALVKRGGDWTLVESARYERHAAEIQRAHDEWQRTFDSMSDALAILDLEHNIVRVNKAMAELTGSAPDLILGKKCYQVMHGLDHPIEGCPKPSCVDAREAREMVYQEPRLGNRWLRTRVEPVYALDGSLVGVLHNVRDVTEQRTVEQLKDEFIGLVSHEMKTPLTVVVGGLHTLITDGGRLDEKDRSQLLLDAYLESQSLSDIVNNLLELSRAQAGRMVLHDEPVKMDALLRAATRRARGQYPDHRFVVRGTKELPVVKVDRMRVERILLNLLDNAAKYSPPGSRVTAFATPKDGELVVGVSDQGDGICLENQQKLFTPFERLGREQSGKGGTGLGLVVCQRLVAAHGGRIWVESEVGEGSTFYFTFPLRQAAAR